MANESELSFDDLEQALSLAENLPSASELHGHLVGRLAALPGLSEAEWPGALARELDSEALPATVAEVLATLRRQTLQQLSRGQLELVLALPDDDTPLLDRVEALAEWCQGFLAGYGLSGAHTAAPEGGLDETLRDFAAVAHAGLTEEDADESGEQDFFAVAEYVRLAAAQACWEARMRAGGSEGGSASEGDPDPSRLFQRGPLH